ncbi:MAG: 2-amino-4-hydroxy-6-hydroxymethyldihydropteridine diphosphokinase [Hahellaceae bacterium]|nr:2-amino-4-hydroxy-6-hydroxymethyldihydropteridine diphosphokinase [Hahellaceae bacterium]
MRTVYLGFGSNLESPCSQIVRAVTLLAASAGLKLLACSSLYRTPPMGPQDQAWFINAVAQFSTSLTPEDLLATTQQLERTLGRIKTRHWGPRVIDIDILMFEGEQRSNDTLNLPHPGLSQRAFVVLPLLEIAPELQLPCGTLLSSLVEAFSGDTIERI